MEKKPRQLSPGMVAALLTPVFMGMAPIFGKQALRSGMDAYTLAALRTCFAALFLWIVYGLFFRKYTFIFPAGLLGTATVGVVNGLGSLLYYNGLLLLDASLAQLLNMTYIIFVMLLMRLYGHHISRMSLIRGGLALLAVYLLTVNSGDNSQVHWVGVGLMLGGAFMYGLHAVQSERVMFEMPAPTMALYALTFMGLTVLLARLVYGPLYGLSWQPVNPTGWWFILGLTAVTALSRVTLFAGVRDLGSLQTTLLNMAEVGVTLLAAFTWLREDLALLQWFGVGLLFVSVILSRWDSKVEDHIYRPLPSPSSFGGTIFNRTPLKPDHFSTISRLYRRPPRPDLSQIEQDLKKLTRQ